VSQRRHPECRVRDTLPALASARMRVGAYGCGRQLAGAAFRNTMDAFAEARRRAAGRYQDLPPRPLSPRFREALDLVSAQMDVEHGIRDVFDLFRILDLFDRLFREDEAPDPRFISEYLTENRKWNPREAEKVAYTWDVVVGLRTLDPIRRRARRHR
jgi:hypothetical protein